VEQSIPEYLSDTYAWAYLNPRNAYLLDRDAVVNAILLGNHSRLRGAALSEIAPGQRVLQVAHVYGCLIPELARRVGPTGQLDVIDIVPLQVARCRQKLRDFTQARVWIEDARHSGQRTYDVVNCFFLLHEIPDQYKATVVDALLARVASGGKVVFIDYHAPAVGNPLRTLYHRLFERFEPYAMTMWHRNVSDFATEADSFFWEKITMFGDLFQKTVARPRG
jgi:ubiquinone/menaquinone biosynthesis C-methylase UbiE